MSECIDNGYGRWAILYEVKERTADRRKQYCFMNIETREIKVLPIRLLKKMRPMPDRQNPNAAKRHPLYRVYNGMKTRCYNENHEGYYWYGAKGIKVCDRWLQSFWNFVEDMGERPKGTTLDRIKGNKGYEPGNCRWATPKEQAQNRKPNAGWRKKRDV